jgi:hypothetical protein
MNLGRPGERTDMGLYLAVKRVGRLYHPSPRRWVRKNHNFLFFYVVGLNTGMMFRHRGDPTHLAEAFSIAYLALIALHWWARRGPKDEEPPASSDAS